MHEFLENFSNDGSTYYNRKQDENVTYGCNKAVGQIEGIILEDKVDVGKEIILKE